MASIYARGGKIWCRLKVNGRWVSKPTGYAVGQEREARAYAKRRQGIVDDKAEAAADDALTVRAYAADWIKDRRGRVQTVGDEDTRLKLHVLPHVGDLKLEDVRPRHVRDMVAALRKGDLAPRTVRHCYSTLRTMLQTAIREELIQSNPCVLGRDELPKKQDKDPAWRATAVFARSEVEALISDPRIPLDRRVLWALLALTGCRFGEVAALRWRAYDRTQEPLGLLSVHASFDKKSKREKSVKTGTPRRVPVHPTLAAILAEWRMSGWAEYTKREGEPARQPTDDDLIIPSRRGDHRGVRLMLTRFHGDLDRLKGLTADDAEAGLRHRRMHDLRRTFISLALTDGARKDVLRWVTHGPEGDIVDLYTTLPWSALCDEVAKLRVSRRDGTVVALPLATSLLQQRDSFVFSREGRRSGRDSNPRPPA